MGSDKRMRVGVALTPDPQFVPVLQGLVSRLAELMGFRESQQLNLQEGVGRTCQRMMEKWSGNGGEEMRLEFNSFSDRLEIMVEGEDDAEVMAAGADSFLLTQLLDRVVFETPEEGRVRVILVKYLSPRDSQP